VSVKVERYRVAIVLALNPGGWYMVQVKPEQPQAEPEPEEKVDFDYSTLDIA
jgi:hypothetical protein